MFIWVQKVMWLGSVLSEVTCSTTACYHYSLDGATICCRELGIDSVL